MFSTCHILDCHILDTGSVAADGEGEHGVYTEALLDALSVPGLKAEEVFKRARERVIDATGEQQTPWKQSSLVGDFVFNLPSEPGRPSSSALGASGQADREALFWHSIQASSDASDFEAYLKRYVCIDERACCLGGKRYRLPSEAEWEYAARGGTGTTRYWGDGLGEICKHANLLDRAFRRKRWIGFGAAECDDGHAGPSPVGRFPPNPFGLHDMLGNVFEWVEDRWHPDYAGAPEDGSVWDRGGDETRRVRRGGSCDKSHSGVRAAYRHADSPNNRERDTGFRVLRELPQVRRRQRSRHQVR